LLTSVSKNQALWDALPPLIGRVPNSQEAKHQAAIEVLMEMHRAYADFRKDMHAASVNDNQRDILLAGLAGIESSIYPGALGNPFRELSEAEKSLLKVCAASIEEEAPVEEEDFAAIKDSIADLRAKVSGEGISPTLRKALLELIRLSEDAIARFRIHGARGLRRAFKTMLADAAEICWGVEDQEQQEELKQSGVWAAMMKHLKLFDAVASKLLKYKPLLDGASQLFLGGPNNPPS
jgi:hypothetical protein